MHAFDARIGAHWRSRGRPKRFVAHFNRPLLRVTLSVLCDGAGRRPPPAAAALPCLSGRSPLTPTTTTQQTGYYCEPHQGAGMQGKVIVQ